MEVLNKNNIINNDTLYECMNDNYIVTKPCTSVSAGWIAFERHTFKKEAKETVLTDITNLVIASWDLCCKIVNQFLPFHSYYKNYKHWSVDKYVSKTF